MGLEAKPSLTENEIESGLTAVLKDGLASQVMATLTGGVFLVGFALALDASNFYIGLLAAIPAITQLLQIPAIYLVERLRARKVISFYSALFARLSLLPIVAAPLAPDGATAMFVLAAALILHTSFSAVSQCAWSSWIRDLVSTERLGRFHAKRLFIVKAFTIMASLAAGVYLDWTGVEKSGGFGGYSALFGASFLAGMVSLFYIYRTPEPRMPPAEDSGGFLGPIRAPFDDVNFRSLIIFLGWWNFAVNLAAPFFTVYLLRRIGLDMSLVVVFSVISQVTFLVSIRWWGWVSDRMNNKSVIKTAGPAYLVCILAWTFTTLPEPHTLTIPLLIAIHVLKGVANAGVTLATANIARKLAPIGKSASYLAASSLVNSLAAGAAPLVGGMFVDYFAKINLSLTLRWQSPSAVLSFRTIDFSHWDFFFLFSFILGLAALYQLGKVKEWGHMDREITTLDIVMDTMRELRNFSTIGGLRRAVQFPFGLSKGRRENRNRNG